MERPSSKDSIARIAEILFDLFVVNDSSVAYQLADGSYRRRSVCVTAHLIEAMIRQGGSLGCYQQQYNTGSIRWICFDFDCADKENPNLEELNEAVIIHLESLLDELGIKYLKEFSGRRGIHVWITFTEIIDKADGYRIFTEIEKLLRARIGDFDEAWNLDRFPATGISKGNLVGKQVKIPLSVHRAGGQSCFLAKGTFQPDSSANSMFFNNQLDLLEAYCENDIVSVMESLGIRHDGRSAFDGAISRRYEIVADEAITADELLGILAETSVFREVFMRLRRGSSGFRERAVLYGTFSCFASGGELLRDVLQRFPKFSSEKTDLGIAKLEESYYPATFGYLYSLYGIEPEDGINLDETGFEFVLRKRGIRAKQVSDQNHLNERTALDDVAATLEKEKRYLLVNDEVPDAHILNELELMNYLECESLSRVIDSIAAGGVQFRPPSGHRVFKRFEANGRIRELVSLSAYDRVLTTQLAMKLCADARCEWNSFSYHVDFISKWDVFGQWYRSWTEYVRNISTYLEIPFLGDYEVFVIDLESFYDNVDLLAVYRFISEDLLCQESKNIFDYLVKFNDMLMAGLHGGDRRGVPQGPAYARILAELLLDRVLKFCLACECTDGVQGFRYVDDMVFFCEPGAGSSGLFEKLCMDLAGYGLPVNRDKSRYFGKVSLLSEGDKNKVSRKDSFNYELHEKDYADQLTARERRKKLRQYLVGEPFEIDSLGYVYGSDVIPEAKFHFFEKHRSEILSSAVGRGQHFRRFYQYVFSSEERLGTVVEERGFSLIPLGSVNFSNFVNELYLELRNGNQVVCDGLGAIAENYLAGLDYGELEGGDRSTLEALLLIAEGASK